MTIDIPDLTIENMRIDVITGDLDTRTGGNHMKRIRSLLLAAAIVAALAAVPASAQPNAGWYCHKTGPYFWQYHCHY